MTVKLGVVGCGFISEIHSSAFAALKDKMEVVACCDRLSNVLKIWPRLWAEQLCYHGLS